MQGNVVIAAAERAFTRLAGMLECLMNKTIHGGAWLLTKKWLPDALASKMLRAAGRAAPSTVGAIWAESVASPRLGRRVLRLADMPQPAQAAGILLAFAAMIHQDIAPANLRPSPKRRWREVKMGADFSKALLGVMSGRPLMDVFEESHTKRGRWASSRDLALSRAYPRHASPEALLATALAQLGDAHEPATAATIGIFAMASIPDLHGAMVAKAADAFGEAAALEAARRFGSLLVFFAKNSRQANADGQRMRTLWTEVYPGNNPHKNFAALSAPALLADHSLADGQDFVSRWQVRRDGFFAGLAPAAFKNEPIIWRMAAENEARAVHNLSAWGADMELPGPDGKRPIELAVNKSRALVFRALLAAGADASTKGPKSRKSPIERSKRLLHSGLGEKLLAQAERAEIMAVAPASPAPAPDQEPPRKAARRL